MQVYDAVVKKESYTGHVGLSPTSSGFKHVLLLHLVDTVL